MFQISVSSTYGLADFCENLLRLYTKVTAWLLLPIRSLLACSRQHELLQRDASYYDKMFEHTDNFKTCMAAER